MIILSIDTSQAASVALVDTESETVLAAEQADDQRRHVEFIGPALARVLENPARPDLVVTGIGPGPFTGLRVGIAAGIAVGQARGIPVRGLLSQAALAEELHRKNGQTTGSVLIAADARRKEVYFSVYESFDASLQAGPFVAKPAEVDEVLAAVGQTDIGGRVGRGFLLYPEVVGVPSVPEIVDPRAEYLALAAAREIAAGRELVEPVPEYLREPDAKATPARQSSLK
ncbi:tRNA threonylcarbamoyl adenosine modification protein YeaZ [Brevibacterium sp. 239c]|uniref:tRNA (adenosine(37)-N6)-threonylcarbamoyltransferase complex dimerization subunit type 1 TsaB n=1 Tax=Brevibacterium sp. 239c TaxID=1965356 RepID=UPI000C674194|nr:tRNA (adenosine(37)-N6)-threonylcarbamoyltransferase complex dimerization subunit type 1 TsaB [Brevibacterium sp. 239c]SMX98953.1 tRNA threonylcarbamoyl adenosine modification protein YeaZ [Brevibacterium sp. 239c]